MKSLGEDTKNSNSVFGLKMKSLGEDTKNQLDNKVQKLEERPPDHTHVFASIG
jgi:mRNA-degrading endonuclease RelE of RelBE toxin-antitoxin system